MLRISLVESDDAAAVIRLEGSIAGPWVDELKQTCLTLFGQGRRPQLNLADVTFVDASGVALLLDLSARGGVLEECSPFLKERLATSDHSPRK